jgi:hypothetical protein
MKKLFVFLMVAGYCLSGRAGEPAKSSVITDAGKMDAKRVEVGTTKARIVLVTGEKKSIPIDQLSSYIINGTVFNKVPLYKNGKSTGRSVFMELVKTRDGFNLYKYEYWDIESAKPYEKIKTAYLFNGDKFQMQLDEKTLADVCNFFGLKGSVE